MSQNKDMALFAAVSLVASNSRVPQKVRTQLSAFNMAEWDCRDAFQDRAAKCLLNAHHDTEFIGLMMKMNNKTRSQLGKNMAELLGVRLAALLVCVILPPLGASPSRTVGAIVGAGVAVGQKCHP